MVTLGNLPIAPDIDNPARLPDVPDVLVVQHLEPEAPYAIERACQRAGLTTAVWRTDLDATVPDLDGMQGLVLMGGPMSAMSDDGYPTRHAELDLVRRALDADLPVLGVCLGAQVLAVAGGGRVYRGHGPEIGWEPIAITDAAGDDDLFAAVQAPLTVLHWHGETLDLPPGATLLASSAAYPNQAFRLGRAWGLQFHLEVDAAAVEAFVHTFGDDAEKADGGATRILVDTPGALHALEPIRDVVLDRFAALVVDHAAGVDR